MRAEERADLVARGERVVGPRHQRDVGDARVGESLAVPLDLRLDGAPGRPRGRAPRQDDAAVRQAARHPAEDLVARARVDVQVDGERIERLDEAVHLLRVAVGQDDAREFRR